MTKVGIMICGHGSRDDDAVEEFSRLATGLRARLSNYPVESGFLEFATPIINTGLDRLKEQGVDHILALPSMLFAAGHAKNDIPSVLNTWEASNPDVTVEYARELGIDPNMIAAAGARIQEALDADDSGIPIEETVLVVVGRGASDPDANANVSKVLRLLWEGFGFAWGEVCYSGVTFPLVTPGLEHISRLGYKRVIVFPYFLFTGVLIKRIYDAVDDAANNYRDIRFVKAPYLNDHDLVLQTFVERIDEILDGDNLMNCKMCKYRTQVLGFEDEVGLPQESHHHHVEGINDSAHHHDHSHDHDHSHSHSHDHNHDHHHHPYPHADHPLGPRTLKQ